MKLKEYAEKFLLKISKEKISSHLNIQPEFKINLKSILKVKIIFNYKRQYINRCLAIYTNNSNNILKTFKNEKNTEIFKILLPDSLDRLFIRLTKKKMNWAKYQPNKIALKNFVTENIVTNYILKIINNYNYNHNNNRKFLNLYILKKILKSSEWVPDSLDNYFYIIGNNKQLKKSYPLITLFL